MKKKLINQNIIKLLENLNFIILFINFYLKKTKIKYIFLNLLN